jgi:DNA-binding MarR family transcriptional regulator
MGRPELSLSNQLCFLFYRIDREFTSRYRPILDKLGLTYPQYLAMLVLWEEGEVTVGALCGKLGLDTGTVSPLLKRLEKVGLVRRARDPADERTVMVRLTDMGMELEKEAAEVPAVIGNCIGLAEEEYLELHARLSELLPRIEATACPRSLK